MVDVAGLFLLDRAESSPLITVHTGYELEAIAEDDDDDDAGAGSVEATFVPFVPAESSNDKKNALLPTERRICHGRLLIGADGVNSISRQHLGLPAAVPFGSTCWRGMVQVKTSYSSDDRSHEQELYHAVLRPLLKKGIFPLGIQMQGSSVLTVFNYHEKLPGFLTWVISTQSTQVPRNSHPRAYFGAGGGSGGSGTRENIAPPTSNNALHEGKTLDDATTTIAAPVTNKPAPNTAVAEALEVKLTTYPTLSMRCMHCQRIANCAMPLS